MKTYRPGAAGALLDEYERAIADLREVIADVSDQELVRIVDEKTADANCKSIQTILAHVVCSGFGYAVSIQHQKGQHAERPGKVYHLTIGDFQMDLTAFFAYTLNIFETVGEHELEQYDCARKMKTSWGQVYDIEQIMEHAIVHILRHRRQIEKFKIALRAMG